LILSLAQGDVPSIALTSHPRITGLFQDLNAEDLLFDIDDFEPKTVADALQLLLGERGRMLMENVEKLRARSQKGISQVVSEIRTY
jgi:polysaccharide pyruvyl transferase WcaK-like protein